MRRFGLALVVLLAFAGQLAADSSRLLLMGGTPGWVRSGAAIDLDFYNGRYYGNGVLGNPANVVPVFRGGPKTNLLPSSPAGFAFKTFPNDTAAIALGQGFIMEGASTNLFLNSTVPVTQTITLPATGSYTLWVNGTGSAAVTAGTATCTGLGSATNGTPKTFSCTVAGTVIITKTGTLNAAQLEAGTFGTSLIVTTGSTASRIADFAFFDTTAGDIVGSANYTAMADLIIPNVVVASTPIYADNGSPFDTQLYAQVTGTVGSFAVTGGGGTLIGPTLTPNIVQKCLIATNPAGRTVAASGFQVSDNFGLPGGFVQIAGSGIVIFRRITLFPRRLPAAQAAIITR